MSHDNRNNLSRIFESGATDNPFDEILVITGLIHPSFDTSLLQQIHNDIARIFAGSFPGFLPSNTQYHNLTHTYSVALATARLLHGLTCSGQDISIPTMEQALYSAYFHDTGLLLETTDEVDSGAIYTKNHEERSIRFLSRYLNDNHCQDSLIGGCAAVISCTILSLDPQTIVFPSPASRVAGFVVGTADLLAQMADRYYLERLPSLFQEHKAGGLKTHTSDMELIRDTALFYQNIVTSRLEKDLDNTALVMQAHFTSRWNINEDLYASNIECNLTYLQMILHVCDNEPKCMKKFLKRTPPT